MCRVPLYYEGKVLFVLWLWHPKTRGAAYLYQHTLQVAHCPEQPSDRHVLTFELRALGGRRRGKLRGLPWTGSSGLKGKHK